MSSIAMNIFNSYVFSVYDFIFNLIVFGSHSSYEANQQYRNG